MDPTSVPEFERQSFYHFPSVAIAQILEDEATLGSLIRTVTNPNGLSPQQRTDLAARLTGDTDSIFASTAADILTNPFVLLMAATAGIPVVGRAIGGAVRETNDIMAFNEKLGRFVRDDNVFSNNLLSATQRGLGRIEETLSNHLVNRTNTYGTRVLSEDGFNLQAASEISDKVARAIGRTTGHKRMAKGGVSLEHLSDLTLLGGKKSSRAAEYVEDLAVLFSMRAANAIGRSRPVVRGRSVVGTDAFSLYPDTTGEVDLINRLRKNNDALIEAYGGVRSEAMKDPEWLSIRDMKTWVEDTGETTLIDYEVFRKIQDNLEAELGLDPGDLDRLYVGRQLEKKVGLIRAIGDESVLTDDIVKRFEQLDDTVLADIEFKVDRSKVRRIVNSRRMLQSDPSVSVDDTILEGEKLLAMLTRSGKYPAEVADDIEKYSKIVEEAMDFRNLDFEPRISLSAPGTFDPKTGVIRRRRPPSEAVDTGDTVDSILERTSPLTDREVRWDAAVLDRFLQRRDIVDLVEVDGFPVPRGLLTKEGEQKMTAWRKIGRNKVMGDPDDVVYRPAFFVTHQRQMKNMVQLKSAFTDSNANYLLFKDYERVSRIPEEKLDHSDDFEILRRDGRRTVVSSHKSLIEQDLVGNQAGKFGDEQVKEIRDLFVKFEEDGRPGNSFVEYVRPRMKKLTEAHLANWVEAQQTVSPYMLMQKGARNTAVADDAKQWTRYINDVMMPLSLNEAPIQARLRVADKISNAEKAIEISEGRGLIGNFLRLAERVSPEQTAAKIKEFRESIGTLASLDATPSLIGGTAGEVAKQWYRTHLGLNPSSMLLNLLQPLTLLASVADDPLQVAKGYGRAFRFMGEYGALRSKSPGLIDDITRREMVDEALRRSFGRVNGQGTPLGQIPTAQDLGLSEDVMSALDFQFKGRQRTTPLDLVLKPFEKTEWFNRVVTADVVRDQALKRGALSTGTFAAEFRSRMQTMTEMFQFGSTPRNTPNFMMKGSGLFSNPLMRQFLSFPTRTLTTALFTTPGLFGSPLWQGYMRQTVMGLGISALIHETTKNLGTDFDRGLYVESLLSGVDLEQGPVPTPPVINIPYDFLKAVTGEDWSLLGRTAMRTFVPGGVALARIPKATGRIPGFPGRMLQNEFVDYSNPIESEDGNTLFPIITRDGRLVEYRSRGELISRALGVDLGAYQEQGGIDQYNLKISQEANQRRRAALDALYRNDTTRYRRIKEGFHKEFGVPLTISDAQLKGFLRSRSQGRTERIINRSPREIRPLLAKATEQAGYARNTNLTIGDTASQRDRRGIDIERELLRMRDQIDAIGGGPTAPRQPDTGFDVPESY